MSRATSTLPVLHVIQAAYGDCLLLDFLDADNDRLCWLIDGGPGNQKRAGSYKVTNNSLFLTMNDEDLKVAALQRVIITHNDSDHTYGAYALISTLKNKEVSVASGEDFPFLKYVSWKAGYESLNSHYIFPIRYIWFNDRPIVAAAAGRNPAGNPGWMTTLMGQFTNDYQGVDVSTVNQDWGSNPKFAIKQPIMMPTRLNFENISQILGPDERNIDRLFTSGQLDSKPDSWNTTALMQRAINPLIVNYPASLKNWAKIANSMAPILFYACTREAADQIDPAVKKGDADTPTNLSSIMFEFKDVTNTKILMTGDGNGTQLYERYGEKPQSFDIVKLPHHGSSNNCMIQSKSWSADIDIVVPKFFEMLQAAKYVISSDTLNTRPNPDVNMIEYMGDQFQSDPSHPVRAVYLTNGASYEGWRHFYYKDDTNKVKRNKNVKFMVLKHKYFHHYRPSSSLLQLTASSNSTDYGTVVPSTDASIVLDEEQNWIPLDRDEDFYSYFVEDMPGYFNQMLALAGKVPVVGTFLRQLLGLSTAAALNASSVATGSVKANKRERAFALKDSRRSTRVSRPTDRYTPSSSSSSSSSRRFALPGAALKMAVMAPGTTLTPIISMNWHDVMVANLLQRSDLVAQDIDNISLPTLIPASGVVADGITQNWVDLPTFLNLLESSNAQLVPSKNQPALDPSYIPMLRWWFLTSDHTQPQTPILASMLLNALFTEEVISELFISLPLNFNGAAAFSADPYAAFQSGPPPSQLPSLAMSFVTLQNFCANVIVPSTAQYASGSTLEIVALYFELNPPPPELCPLPEADVWTWTLPYSTDVWLGNAVFQHNGPMKVKMLYPTYQDALTFCSFDANLKISRGTPVTLPVHGTMYTSCGTAASYDIQFVGGMDALNLLNIFACNSALATALLSNLAKTVQIPGIDLSAILNNSIQLKDAGIILRQHQPRLTSIAIEDMYGTISTSGILQQVQLAGDFLHIFPPGLQIPSNLPDITITATNITGPNSHKVSLAFSQTVTGIGAIIFQVAKGADNQTTFDIFAITDEEISVGDMLGKLGNSPLLQSFEAARLFTGTLSALFVPYAHLSFGPTTTYQVGSGYSMQQLTLAISLDANASIPSDNPLVTLEDISLEILYDNAEEGIASDMSVYGSANVVLGGFDASCTFRVDHTGDEIEAFLEDDFSTPSAPTSGDSTGGFQGLVYLTFDFPSDKPSIGDIIDGFLNEVADATGLNSLTKNIPPELFSILDSSEFQVLEMQIQNDETTGNKWQIGYFHLQVLLYGLDDVLNLLPGVKFSLPVLDIFLHAPSDPVNKAYQVSLGSILSLQGGLCDISANFDRPPNGFQTNPSQAIGVSLIAQPEHPGLPLGSIVSEFVGKGLDALDVNIQNLVPTEIQDVINSITIDEAMLAFLNTGTKNASHWQAKFVEATVTSAHEPFSPFENFSISNIQLHFSHDFGIDVVPANIVPPTTQVQFNVTLTVKTIVINAGFTYDSNSKGWTFTFNAGQTINLVDLMLAGIDSLGFEIPATIGDSLNQILQIDTQSFYVAYTEGNGPNPEAISFSNDAGTDPSRYSALAFLISAFSAPGRQAEEFGFSPGIPLLDGIIIKNGRFAFAKGTPAAQVVGNAQIPKSLTSSSVILSGQIVLGGSGFMNLISSMINLDEFDICILPGVFSVDIPATSNGLSIMNVFILQSFSLEFFEGGFGLGAKALLDTQHASWLSKTPVSGSFLLMVMADTAIGAQAEISNITNPFGLPGISLVDASFSMTYLLEAESIQSLAASASIVVTEGGSPISGSFALAMDPMNQNNDYFRLNIQNLTLVDIISTMTLSSCPDFLKPAQIGFKSLAVDLEIASIKFSFDADFYIFALEGKVHADVEIANGISLAANLNPVDILGLIQIHEYHSNALGTFVYLDCTIATIKNMATGTTTGPPAWTGVTSATDPNLKGAVFALSATMVFLGAELDVYGIINTSGLQLTVTKGTGLSVPDGSFSLSESFSIAMDSSTITAGTTYNFNLSLDFPSFDILGVSIGSYDGTVVELDDALSLSVPYTVSNWHNIGADFYVMINADILGLSIKDQKLELDITITNLQQLPGAIEQYVKDQVADYLKAKIAAPIVQFGEDLKADANKAIAALQDGFNILGADIISLLSDAGHAIEDIADGLKNTLGYTIDEVAGALNDFGHDINEISDILGDVFLAGPQEVFSALTSAGVTVEHAVDAVYSEAGAEFSKDFNLVGNSIAGFALDAGAIVDHFLDTDVAQFADNTISDAGTFFEGVGDQIGNFFSSIF